jgi:hypothetical protein
VTIIGIGVRIWLARKKKTEESGVKLHDNPSGNVTNVHNYGGNFHMNNKASRF